MWHPFLLQEEGKVQFLGKIAERVACTPQQQQLQEILLKFQQTFKTQQDSQKVPLDIMKEMFIFTFYLGLKISYFVLCKIKTFMLQSDVIFRER